MLVRLSIARPAAAARARAALAAAVTTQAGGPDVVLGRTTATPAGTAYAEQEGWMSRGVKAAERAEQAAEGAMSEAPQFALHRAGLGFDLSAMAEAIRASWGGRGPEAAAAVAKMVADPSLARRVPFPPPPTTNKGGGGEDEEGEAGGAALPLRWRRMTPDAAADEWYEIPTAPKK